MVGNIFLQIFLFLDVFIVGILAAIAFRHAYAHYHPEKHEAESHSRSIGQAELPVTIKAKLLKESEERYEAVLSHGAERLEASLKETVEHINDLIKRLSTEIISQELQHYQADLSKLHVQAEKDLGGIKQDMNGYQDQIKSKVAAEYEAEKERRVKQIDQKLADAVGSFLVETLQHNIDLGSQGPYLVSLLEKHKADFIKEVSDES